MCHVVIEKCHLLHVAACLVDIALVLDHSSSVGSTNWRILTDFLARFVSSIHIGVDGTRVGAVSFGTLLKYVS